MPLGQHFQMEKVSNSFQTVLKKMLVSPVMCDMTEEILYSFWLGVILDQGDMQALLQIDVELLTP